MGQRLRSKHKKTSRTIERLNKAKLSPPRHKVAVERSVKAKFRKNNRMA